MNPEWRTGAIGLVLLEISDHNQVFPESNASALCYTEEKLHPEFRKKRLKDQPQPRRHAVMLYVSLQPVPALLPSLCWGCMLDRGSWMRKFLWFSTFTQQHFTILALALPYSVYHYSLCDYSLSLIKQEGKPVPTDTFYISCLKQNASFALSPPWIS